MWIFGYGSLIFRPGFSFIERRRAFVTGFARRFWQGSPDHRGTVERPGRVVTLVPIEGGVCGGMAYRIESAAAPSILASLDHRERAGFERRTVVLLEEPSGGVFAEGVTWVAHRDNPWFIEELSTSAIAEVVRSAHGPSGANADYARELSAALRALDIDDEGVEALIAAL